MRWPSLVLVCASATALIFWHSGSPLRAQVSDATSAKTPLIIEGKGLPPRSAASDYSAHAQAGSITIGADFTGHTLNTQDGLLSTQDYVVVEAGVFGAAGAHVMLSPGDFSLRINGSKKPLPMEPLEVVAKSLKDPDYEEPESNKSGGKTMVNSGGGKADGTDPNAPPPALIPIPFELKRAWQQRAKRDSLAIGDRPLPQAGLLFFQYGSPTKGLRSIELIYSGSAGKATLSIHP
jgi:hypothetical protein